MRRSPFVAILISLLLSAEIAGAAKPSPPPRANGSLLVEMRYWSYPDHTRIVFDVDPLPRFRKTEKGEELTVMLSHTRPADQVPQSVRIDDGIAKEVRVRAEGPKTSVSVLLDNSTAHKLFSLTNPDRIVIDLFRKKEGRRAQPDPREQVNSVVSSSLADLPKLDVRTIVIDPGHGGKDPGAIGPGGLAEKEIVLDIALRLRKLLTERSQRKVVMTRTRDVFIPLDERTLLANGKKADLFVSIHANASPQKSTRGIEIYLLGQATDQQAMETAARENNSSTDAAIDLQKAIFNDLESDFNLNESLELAHTVRGALSERVIARYPTPDLGVKRAPFFVLANSRMPAILAELSFISNPVEEKRLRNPSYRQQLAEALFTGLEQYIAAFRESF
jgi:N-acetylmuramoyl-L-alanine amidase